MMGRRIAVIRRRHDLAGASDADATKSIRAVNEVGVRVACDGQYTKVRRSWGALRGFECVIRRMSG
jgi:hypothetical protein